MALSEDQIRILLDWYLTSSETRKRYSEYRKTEHEKNHIWIQPDAIQRMSDEELEANFFNYYKKGGGRQSLNQIYRDRIIRDKEKFRKTLLYLLDNRINIEKRVNDILSGQYRIEGFGKAILTSFLMDYDANNYSLWNNKTEMGFSALDWKVYEAKDSPGSAYTKILKALERLRNIKPEYKMTFDDIDLFLHTISAEDEGVDAVRAIEEGGEIIKPPPPEVERMEFAMEKYLEEFIEANFTKINFGAKLELCQDEENTGRQYPTPIGNIDLLAMDKDKKEFVVIELKKGRSSDTVVGQILRYMGYVKEHLAGDYSVRGIIITKEKDDRLKYALKFIPNVELFLYSVNFDIEKVF